MSDDTIEDIGNEADKIINDRFPEKMNIRTIKYLNESLYDCIKMSATHAVIIIYVYD